MTGRFSEAVMTEALRNIAAALGVSPEAAQLLQLTNNAVFALPRSGLVIRIARTHQLRSRVTKVVQLGRWFARIDAPTIRLAPDVNQPVRVGGVVASVWSYVKPTPPAPTVEDLGHVLREFHALDAASIALPAWDPVGDARRRLVDAEGLDANDRDFLVKWCDRLEPQLVALNHQEEPKLVHGDAHVGNLLREPSGRPVMCDFDATCIGPWQVDLAAVAVGEARFGGTGLHERLANAYGYDVTSDQSWTVLREARELKMIAAAVPLISNSASVAEEFINRLQSVRNDDPAARWTPFANLSPSHQEVRLSANRHT
ncbi:aminoglycoside phosphotransferase (APT) family kinase protein [Micromonospora violae]|uniref:Aminoglycoside phosphotransferase (APT) family kinase protein n=1 Tax=Micromonospora violae TaxID=1278207 RepID=A0A4Q7UP91_9ACTN|nr:aminoglycoside phosphotransferase family protein [Micromonospora violae]RZT82844.1 aminoglycoside phosphotransferase (APT) family kinase protein [Micromonospora violae]